MAEEPRPIETDRDSPSDSFISRAVLESKLVEPRELRAALAKQRKYAAAGRQVKLVDILVKVGFITKTQIARLGSPADDTMAQSLQQIPGFRILQKIGSGAMASVYKAKQLSLDRIVAIKVLPKRLSEDPTFVQRFQKEGRAAAKLSQSNIVQAIDVGEYLGYHYFVMEFVDGKTVYDELAEKGRLGEREALEIIIQIARALEHAHARGFIHRDVKPKNIMITKDGTAKLADMGLTRELADAEAAVAEKGRAYGTPYYISPEQIRGVVDVDFRADIYSMGATFYHMVTGKVPFEGHTPAEIMHQHLCEPLVPPDHLNAQLSAGLGEVVERAMAKDRNLRYQSTHDLLLDLECVKRGEAPLQARSKFNDKLLQDLAGGGEVWSAGDASGAYAQNLPNSDGLPGYAIALIAALVVETLAILVLLLVVFTRQ